jgi:DNA-directed RNA polymerase specialized sigma24 family protein
LKFFGHSRNAAEELIKRVFVSAFEQIDAYPEAGTFILWLRTIAVYEVRKGDIEESIASHEAGGVEKAILSLPIEERVIFVLHDVDKLRLEEITVITKDSEEHIEIELERARKLMMDKLRIKQFNDLDYKISFLPQKVEPAPQFWKVILNVINKTEPENSEVNEEKKDRIGKKLLGLFKKKS